ncbi:MAG: hypothetical protein ACE5F5_06180 [Acidimicrobiia bacterium]
MSKTIAPIRRTGGAARLGRGLAHIRSDRLIAATVVSLLLTVFGPGEASGQSLLSRFTATLGPFAGTAEYRVEREEGPSLTCRAILFGSRTEGYWLDVCEEDTDDDEETDFWSFGGYFDGRAEGAYGGSGRFGAAFGPVSVSYPEPPEEGPPVTTPIEGEGGDGVNRTNTLRVSGTVTWAAPGAEPSPEEEEFAETLLAAWLACLNLDPGWLWPDLVGDTVVHRAPGPGEGEGDELPIEIIEMTLTPGTLSVGSEGSSTGLLTAGLGLVAQASPVDFVTATITVAGDIPELPDRALSYKWFLDIDRDPTTGSPIESIGAEYIFLVEFDSPLSPGEWAAALFAANEEGGASQVRLLGSVEWRVQGGQVSIQIDLEELGSPDAFRWIAVASGDGVADFLPNEGFAFWTIAATLPAPEDAPFPSEYPFSIPSDTTTVDEEPTTVTTPAVTPAPAGTEAAEAPAGTGAVALVGGGAAILVLALLVTVVLARKRRRDEKGD